MMGERRNAEREITKISCQNKLLAIDVISLQLLSLQENTQSYSPVLTGSVLDIPYGVAKKHLVS